MKKLLGILALTAIATSLFAQGTVTFVNQTGLVKQWTSTANTTLMSVTKSTGWVQMLSAPIGAASLTPLFTADSKGFLTANYQTLGAWLAANPAWDLPGGTANPTDMPGQLLATANGIFNLGTRTIQNIDAGAQAQYAVLGWTGAGFATFDAALLAAKADPAVSFLGVSAIFTTATGNPTTTPAGVAVLISKSFGGMTLAPLVVPEPGTFALAGLGLATLLIFRRRS